MVNLLNTDRVKFYNVIIYLNHDFTEVQCCTEQLHHSDLTPHRGIPFSKVSTYVSKNKTIITITFTVDEQYC